MTELPKPYRQFQAQFPEVARAYDALGEAAHGGGPLDERTRRLVKLSMAIAGGHEGAVHAQTRRALESGVTSAEIYHVLLLALTSLGFPATVAAYTWVKDILPGE